MNDIIIFNNPTFGEIRTVMSASNEPLFCLTDVCKVLDLIPSKVSQRLDDDVLSKYPIIDNLGRTQQANFVNEDGLYDVVLDSRKPEAKQFRKWVTSEVLPSIRKTGGYIATTAEMSDLEIVSRALMIANGKIEQRNRQITDQQEKIKRLETKTKCFDSILSGKNCLSVTQISTAYGMTAKEFNLMLQSLRIQYRVSGQWILYSPYITQDYTRSHVFGHLDKDGRKVSQVLTVWTQKGRAWLYDKLKEYKILPLAERDQIEQTIQFE